MPGEYEVILRGGLIVDPANGRQEVADIALKDAKVARVDSGLAGRAQHEHDVSGLVVLPGIIDSHVHLSPWLGGAPGHRMLALAGVTCALEMAGPIDGVTRLASTNGCGLTIACIDWVRPGATVETEDPSAQQVRACLARARSAGAIGLKILGGHFPLTPDASARVIGVAAREGAYVAFHAGTLQTPQGLGGMREACDLADGNPLHLAHINSYTRASQAAGVMEAEEALALLAERPNVWSESYLSPVSGNSGTCSAGRPESVATRRHLERGGFPPTTGGMADAILSGWARVHLPRDGVHVLSSGEEALAAWRDAETAIGVSFVVNPAEPRLRLATARRPDRRFAVDALATDGGGIPRNDLCARGLALVHLDALDVADFVRKTSVAPARALGLQHRKGHLGEGADGDITVIDLDARAPVMSFAHGKPVLMKGEVRGRGARMLVPPEGMDHVRGLGIDTILAEPGLMLPPKVD